MWKVTVKGLLAHRLRFALTALAVLLGVAFMSGAMVFGDTIKRTFDNLVADVYRGTDAVVRGEKAFESDFGDQRNRVPESLLVSVKAVDGVKAAEGNVSIPYAQLVDRKGKAIGNPGAGAPTLGFNWSTVKELNSFHIESGGHPPRTPDEIVIDKGSADKGHFKVGDRAKVLTAREPKEYTIAGVAKFGTADSPAGASIVLWDTPTAQQVAGALGKFDGIGVVGEPGVSQTELRDRIRAAIPDKKIEVVTGAQVTKENQDAFAKALSFINYALYVFVAVGLLVGIFIIYNTFSIVVAQRIRELALLRAIGAGQGQVMLSVLGESLVVGLGASAVGVVAGIGLSSGLKGLFAVTGFDIPAGGTVVTTRTVLLSLVVGSVITIASAILPARKAGRAPPVAALQDVAVEHHGNPARRAGIGLGIGALGGASLLFGLRGNVDSALVFVGAGAVVVFIGVFVLGPVISRPVSRVLGSPFSRLRGITGTLARENAMRSPKRTSATAAALMIGVALVGFITIFAASVKASISAVVDDSFRSDFVLARKGFGAGFSPELARKVAALPEVAASTGIRGWTAQVDGKTKLVIAAEPAAMERLFDLQGSGRVGRLGPTGLAVTKRIAGEHHWKVGSQVKLRFAATGEKRFTVQAIYRDDALGQGTYLITRQSFEQNFTPDQQLDFQVYAKLAPGVTPTQGKKAIEQVAKAYPSVEVQDRAEFKADREAIVNQIVNLIYGLLALSVVIALFGIVNTLALSILERTRELGLLRAVGMTRRQLRATVRGESVIIALFGALLGLLVGLFFGWAVVTALRDEGITHLAVAPQQLLVVVVLSVVIGVLAGVFPARRAAKLDVLRAVTTE